MSSTDLKDFLAKLRRLWVTVVEVLNVFACEQACEQERSVNAAELRNPQTRRRLALRDRLPANMAVKGLHQAQDAR